jgi:hypothetical protein
MSTAIVPVEQVQKRIHLIRSQRVMLDADLAEFYGVTTKQLNQQVRRNAKRFSPLFMFQLRWDEAESLRSQIVTSNPSGIPETSEITASNPLLLRSQIVTSNGRGGRRYRPFAFTEYGVLMVATVLKSEQADKVSVFLISAFVKLREILAAHHELSAKLSELERKLDTHDGQILALIDAIRELMEEPEEPQKPPIGFATEAIGRPSASQKRTLQKRIPV